MVYFPQGDYLAREKLALYRWVWVICMTHDSILHESAHESGRMNGLRDG